MNKINQIGIAFRVKYIFILMGNFDLHPYTNLFVLRLCSTEIVFSSLMSLWSETKSTYTLKFIGIQVEFCQFNGRPKIYLAQALISIKTYTLKFFHSFGQAIIQQYTSTSIFLDCKDNIILVGSGKTISIPTIDVSLK